MNKKELTRRLLLEAGLEEKVPAPSRAWGPGPGKSSRKLEGMPRILVVVDLLEKDALQVLRELSSLRRFGFQVDALAEAGILPHLKERASFGNVYDAARPLSAEVLADIFASLRAVIVVSSQDLLARLALGLQDKPAATVVLQGLWRGVDVYMDLEGAASVRGVPCRNAALGKLYASYGDALRGMGVKPVSPPYLTAMLDRRQELLRDAQRGAQEAGFSKRIVVTEKDVLAFDAGSRQWILPGDAVVTSLAKDAAEKRGLLLKKDLNMGEE
jgi:hypothetical protein